MGWTFRPILNLSFHDSVSWTYYGLMNLFLTINYFHLSMTSSKIQSRLFLLLYKLHIILLQVTCLISRGISYSYTIRQQYHNTINNGVFFLFAMNFILWLWLIDICICMRLMTGNKILFIYVLPWESSSFIWDLEIVCNYKFFLFNFWNLYASLIKEFMLFAYLHFPWHGLFCNIFVDLLP